jgi:hexosaminidase
VTRPERHLIRIMASALLSSLILMAQETDLRVVPLPERVVLNTGKLVIDGNFRLKFTGYTDMLLQKAAIRLIARLQARTGIPMPLPSDSDPNPAVLEVQCGGAGEPVQSVMADESYQLEVTDRLVKLTAAAPVGVLRGMETFLQLVELDNQSFHIPAVKIEDHPRFRWRGLHIDVSRHWEPAEVIRRNLDAMAAAKMNVLHWHLSDDQGFRVESLKFPRLHEKGSDGRYYTQTEVRAIIEYARDRGIRVIPEFDMPGHSTAWLVGYPELASAPGPYQIERTWGVFDPCMDPTQESTYSFLDTFIGEMAGLFPDEYFHIGGDEVNEKQWNASASIRAFKTRRNMKDNQELQAYFNQRLLKIITNHGKKMMGWDEILHPDLPRDVVVQVWRRQPSISDAVRRGFPGILSYGYYLDQMQPSSFHYDMDPLGKDTDALSAEERARVYGGEACMWAELVNPENIESRIWPRTAAIAERLWSPSAPVNTPDLYRRLDRFNQELESLGVQHSSHQIEMLQRMAGNQDVAPLKMLSELLIPTGLSPRLRTKKYSSFSPLNRMVDTVLPESKTARLLGLWIQSFLADPSGAKAQQIRAALTGWKVNNVPLQAMIGRSYLLEEVRPIANTVEELCARGLQAMDFIQNRQKAPESWEKDTKDLFTRAERPQAEMLPSITGSIRRLFEAVVTEKNKKNRAGSK